MNWIVIWVVSLVVSIPCPNFKPDPYTGKYPNIRCSVNHLETIEKNMSREFATREEAQAFINNAPKDIKKTMELKEMVDRTGEAR